ncbi:MAG: hypothetical protein IT313_10770 [Anaerolineales bacterium]|nr:hypothetical protein [Anaerolineae bacterium]MBL8107539.1 hypothetical protein [Anaerolineales bacterium]MCC6500738.1 hypothetical protein [Anaerolineales bacterium]
MKSRWFYFLCSIEGAVALVALLLIPSEGASLSPARLALSAIIFSLMLMSAWFAFRPPQLDRLARTSLILLVTLLSLTFSLILFLLRYLNPEAFLPLYTRLSPLLWYLLALSIQFALYLLHLKNGFHLDALKQNKPIFVASFAVFALLLLLLLFVSLSKLGITKDTAYWGEPGVPILGWQFLLSILLGATILIYQLRNYTITNYQLPITKFSNSPILNFLLPLAIYLTASTLWLSVPVDSLKNSFYAPITPPYTTPFPYSDAGFYDYLSQSLLIGTDYLGNIAPRPLYVTFLAALHFLFGQDYVKVIAAQTLVFALFPVALYFLGAKLHSRAAGVTVALFAIFRELTTLWISSNTRTASTKMFITDFATSMGIAFVMLVVIRWLERRDMKSAIIAGGSFGLLLLLRTQSLISLPFVFILAFFAYQRKMKNWFLACVTFGLVMTATITPWLIHNYRIVGQFAFDDPSQMAVIFSQYSFEGNLDISQFDFEKESLGNRLLTFTLENPGFVAGFVTNHFLNTEIGGLLSLPLIEPFNGLRAPVNLYWIEWNGTLEWYNFALVIFYLAVIAIGIGASWSRFKWAGLTPLAFSVGYALANGISRFSSWRYNLPIDWIVYFYFGIGAIEILVWFASLFGANVSNLKVLDAVALSQSERRDIPSKSKHAILIVAFVLAGSLPWLAEGIAQPRYTSTADELKTRVILQDSSVEEFLSQPNSIILEGELLYPRFFRRNDGIFSTTPWAIYSVRDFSRLGFIVLNTGAHSVIFPADQPVKLTHGADVIVVGCQRANYIEARWLFFPKLDEAYQAEALNESCNP